MEKFSYVVEEEYKGKKIEVKVNEWWSFDGIEEALVSCPKYSTIIRGLGHKCVNMRPSENGGVEGDAVRLTVSDVHDAIFKEFFIAEESICSEINKEHDNFYHSRFFRVIVEYKNQEIIIPIMMNSNSDKVWITCPSSALVKGVTMENDAYIFAIYDEVKNSKKLIDDGYVFAKPTIIDKVKKKVKSLF